MPKHNTVSTVLMSPFGEAVNEHDTQELQEWVDAFDAIVETTGIGHARHVLEHLANHAVSLGVDFTAMDVRYTPPGEGDAMSELEVLAKVLPLSTRRANESLDRAIAAFERIGV